jgi:hypothetical protein
MRFRCLSGKRLGRSALFSSNTPGMSFIDCPVFRTQPCCCSVKSSNAPLRLPRPFKVVTSNAFADRQALSRLAPHSQPDGRPFLGPGLRLFQRKSTKQALSNSPKQARRGHSASNLQAFCTLQRTKESRYPNSRLATPAGALPGVFTPSKSRATKPAPEETNQGLPSLPRRVCFTSAALMGFYLQGFTQPGDRSVSPRLILPCRCSTHSGAPLDFEGLLPPGSSDRPKPATCPPGMTPSEVLPLATTPHSFLRAPLTRFASSTEVSEPGTTESQ